MAMNPQNIQYAHDDRLTREIVNLEHERARIGKSRKNFTRRKAVEDEICYIQRELEHRIARKRAHAQYMRKNQKYRANRANRR